MSAQADGASARRQTIKRPVSLEGYGLHLGVAARLTFRPAPDGTGVVFRRTDLPGQPTIPAQVDRAVLTERRTQLAGSEAGAELHTVEHVLAAVCAADLDDLWIDVDGPEPPILDGSAAPFFEALRSAGLAAGQQAAEYLELRDPVRVIDGASVYEAFPASSLTLDVTIDFPHPMIGRQQGSYVVTPERFGTELAPARTFGFLHEQEMLRAKGLIRGASTENAVVLTDVGLLEGTLRWPDEFVRHKAMDCVGDLALAGRRVRARVSAIRPSHRGTVTLVREMVKAAIPVADPQVATARVIENARHDLAHGPIGATLGSPGARQETRMSESPRDSKPARKSVLSIDELMKVIPHRYPFLLVDRILEIEERKRIVGLKNVTINEPFFQGHFPGHPIMPGVLIIEAMAQVGGVLLMGAVDNHESKVVYFMSLDNVKFRRPVRPGDQMRFELEITQIRGSVCKMRGVARVDGDIVAEADMAAIVRDR
jgi:UDP-3-O-[3-hydroxymyristoyl] N-acetylglucosamine deacetylase/3-hydroxyacyl-[acyl-carrier-protein] dehydratase